MSVARIIELLRSDYASYFRYGPIFDALGSEVHWNFQFDKALHADAATSYFNQRPTMFEEEFQLPEPSIAVEVLLDQHSQWFLAWDTQHPAIGDGSRRWFAIYEQPGGDSPLALETTEMLYIGTFNGHPLRPQLGEHAAGNLEFLLLLEWKVGEGRPQRVEGHELRELVRETKFDSIVGVLLCCAVYAYHELD